MPERVGEQRLERPLAGAEDRGIDPELRDDDPDRLTGFGVDAVEPAA